MRLSYRRTFSQFADSYLATYYSSGVQTIRRRAAGPFYALIGGLLIVFGNNPAMSLLFRVLLYVAGVALVLYGLGYTLLPFFNLFLVWLRREEFLGPEGTPISLEIKAGQLIVREGKNSTKIPIKQIKTVQQRSDSSWLLTESDQLIAIPRHGLLSGDHDKFIEAVESALSPKKKSKRSS